MQKAQSALSPDGFDGGRCKKPRGVEYWKGAVVGVCSLWSAAQPSQNKKRNARRQRTRDRRGENSK